MGNRRAERGLGRQFGVHMDKLVIAGNFGKGVNLRLVDQDPVRHTDFGADHRLIVIQ